MRKTRHWLALGATLLIAATLPAQTLVKTLTFEGMTRSYRVYVPPSYSAANPAPLVFNLHGYTSNAQQQEFYSEMNPVADTAGFIAVYPEGVNNAWNFGQFPNGPNDVAFISVLIDSMMAHYNIDPARVYSCGMSNGGYMSFKLACELDERIAAIASVTGSMAVSNANACSATRPVPVMQIHGTQDGVVNYYGSPGSLSIDSAVGYWRQRNNCTAPVVHDTLPDLVNEGSIITTQRYAGCDDGVEVLHYKVENGSHSWPGALPVVPGITNQDVEASVEIWRFFYRYEHPNPVLTGVAESVADEHFPVFYPQPAREELRMDAYDHDLKVRMADIRGREAGSWEVPAGKPLRIDVRKWQPGLYLVVIEGAERTERARVVIY